MSRALLDIDVLVALLDSANIDHARARAWLDGAISQRWASCAIPENGFVTVVSQPGYPSPVSPAQALAHLARATGAEHHEYWPCAITLLDERIIDRSRVHGPRHVTDTYLLALAVDRGRRFVTFDRAVPLSAVHVADASHLTVMR